MQRAARPARVVVTAGGTHEPIDPVRFIGNRASGRMGFALGQRRPRSGCAGHVTAGGTAPPPAAVDLVCVETAIEMRDAVHAAINGADLLIMNAAVADFRPAEWPSARSRRPTIKRSRCALVRNPDISGRVGPAPRYPVKIGFAGETHDLEAYACAKLAHKGWI
ncbi:MAG: phosphopantothenoylcysteine decarboxylase [Kouleothrix sp.]